MDFFSNTTEQVLSNLHTDRENGLTAAEAEKRLHEHGANVLK